MSSIYANAHFITRYGDEVPRIESAKRNGHVHVIVKVSESRMTLTLTADQFRELAAAATDAANMLDEQAERRLAELAVPA